MRYEYVLCLSHLSQLYKAIYIQTFVFLKFLFISFKVYYIKKISYWLIFPTYFPNCYTHMKATVFYKSFNGWQIPSQFCSHAVIKL